MLDEYIVIPNEDDEESQNKTGRLEIRKKNDSERPEELFKSGTPLFVIDDVLQSKDFDLSTIKPEDIKEMSVMKGEGRNGTIVIKTKGKEKRTDRLELRGNIESIQSKRLLKSDSPLYIVDGVVQAKGFDASSINSKDIDNISVLKKESAIKLYGKDASNGVVVIETKRKPE